MQADEIQAQRKRPTTTKSEAEQAGEQEQEQWKEMEAGLPVPKRFLKCMATWQPGPTDPGSFWIVRERQRHLTS